MLLTAIHLIFGAAFADSPDRNELTGNLGVLDVFTCWSTWVFFEHKTCTPILRTYNSSIVVVFQHWEALYSVQSPLSHWPPPARTGFYLRAGGGVARADLNIDYKQCLLDYYDETICDPYVDEFQRDFEDTIDGGIIGIVHATREQSIWLCGSDACGRSVMVQEPGSGV